MGLPAEWARKHKHKISLQKQKSMVLARASGCNLFLCSYMGRGKKDSSPIRFILNLSEALATNSYLMLYPKEHLQKAISDNPNSVYRIWESLKGISGNDIEEEGRIYGGGLKKIEPSELAKVSCGDLMKLCFA